jgi:protein tyrosine phosphatase
MDLIIPHVYISAWDESNDIELLKKNNIKAVITIETKSKPEFILNYYKNNNIDFMYLFLYDFPTEDIKKYFDCSYKFIDKHVVNNENVLIHCRMGISRSATIILNYLIRKIYENRQNKNINPCYVFNLCLNLMVSTRHIINPNFGFITQIQKAAYEYSKM